MADAWIDAVMVTSLLVLTLAAVLASITMHRLTIAIGELIKIHKITMWWMNDEIARNNEGEQ